jgi:hypothetical protein
MKRVKRTIQIEVETERSVVFACRRESVRWCSICEREISFVSLAEVAALAGSSAETLIRNQRLHLHEQTDGQVLICINSLNQSQTP